jgi:hypothetical protein
VSGDVRGWRIALVPDALLNPPDAAGSCLDVLRVLEACGYGVLQLPPTAGTGDAGPLLAVIADQVAEYVHHGYAVVAIGLRGEPGSGLHWRRLTGLLRHRGVAPPPRQVVNPRGRRTDEEQRLADFLIGYDVPDEQQRIWRT